MKKKREKKPALSDPHIFPYSRVICERFSRQILNEYMCTFGRKCTAYTKDYTELRNNIMKVHASEVGKLLT